MKIECTLRSVNDVTEGITQEPPMGASWVMTRWFEFLLNLALKKMMGASYYKAGQTIDWEKKTMRDSWVIPS